VKWQQNLALYMVHTKLLTQYMVMTVTSEGQEYCVAVFCELQLTKNYKNFISNLFH